jgi:hypothetical protein
VNIRAYTDSDLAALRSMHAAQGFGYELPIRPIRYFWCAQ